MARCSACSALALTLILGVCVTPAQERRDGADELRDYHAGNGLLNRGLYDLAAAEYRKFLKEHEGHAKAPVARYGLAVCLFRQQKPDEAAEQLEKLHGERGFEFAAEAALLLGQCRLSGGDLDGAAKLFGEVVQKFGEHELADDAAAHLVESLYRAARYDDAAKRADAAVRRWPESPQRWRIEYLRALADVARESWQDAAERLDGLLAAQPDGPYAHQATLLRAQCHHRLGQRTDADAGYRRVLKTGDAALVPDALYGLATLQQQQNNDAEAAGLLDQLVKSFADSPLLPAAHLQRARIWFAQGEYSQAAEALARVGADSTDLQDDVAYWSAKCALKSGDAARAAELYAEAIERFSKSELAAEMRYDQAVALVAAGNEADAIAALRDFIERFEDDELLSDALALLATTEHRAGDLEASREHCQAFLAKYGDHASAPTIRFLVAENDYLAGRFDQAVQGFRKFVSELPQDSRAVRARFRLGMALYRLEKFEEAERELLPIADQAAAEIELQPALLAIGDIRFHRGEWKPAEEALGRFLASGLDVPGADDALLKLALAQQRQGRNEEALSNLERLLAKFPMSPCSLQTEFERGQVLVALNRPDEAAKAFEHVLAEGPDSRFAPFAQNHLGALALQGNDYELAAERFDAAAQRGGEAIASDALFQKAQALLAGRDYERAGDCYEQFIRQAPNHAQVRRAMANLAIALSRQEMFEKALAAIARAEQHKGELPESLRESLEYEKAWCLRRTGENEEAATTYRGLLARDADAQTGMYACLELAGIELEARRYPAAAELLRDLAKKLEARPDAVPSDVRAIACYRLGVCEFELGQFAAAAAAFERFVASFPESGLLASASLFCGEALFKLGQFKKSAEHLERVVERFQEDPGYGPALLRLGECRASLQLWPQSEAAFARFLAKFPESEQWFQARFGLGWAQENQQRYEEALTAYRTVVERHKGPTAARAQFQIGECLFAQKKHEEAVRELLKVDILYAYPEWSAAALYEAGRCFESLGKAVEARAQFKAVVEKYKESRWATLAAQRLSETSDGVLPGRETGRGM